MQEGSFRALKSFTAGGVEHGNERTSSLTHFPFPRREGYKSEKEGEAIKD